MSFRALLCYFVFPLTLLLGVFSLAQAQLRLVVDDDFEEQRLFGQEGFLHVFNDTSGQLTVDQVDTGRFSFNKVSAPSVINKNEEATQWIRCTIELKKARTLLLEASTPYGENTLYYKHETDNTWQRETMSLVHLQETAVIPRDIYELSLKPGTYIFYMEVKTALYWPTFYDKAYFERTVIPQTLIFLSLIFGGLAIILFYNMFLGIATLDRLYILYVLYMVANLFFLLHLSWVFRLENILNGHRDFPFEFIEVFVYIAIYFILLFAWSFYAKKVSTKLGRYAFYSLFLANTVAVLLSPFLSYSASLNFVSALGFLTSLLILISSFRAWLIKKYKMARFFAVAFLFYNISVVLYVVNIKQAIFEHNVVLDNLIMVGSALEAIFLSLALADRIQTMKKEREEAQVQALIMREKNEQLLKEQNRTLEQKVSERTKEVVKQHGAINDSIRYASTIQEAVLPSVPLLEAAFTNAFVLYRPQHIVSGDFFWYESFDDYELLAVGDCTGHGVPGAFMSLLGMTFLSEAAQEKTSNYPAQMLEQINQKVISSLKQEHTGNQDGMELIICRLEKEEIISSASKLAFIVVNTQAESQVYKGTRRYIGKTHASRQLKAFEEHRIPRTKDSMLYLSSDGFQDQPNPARKKFGSKRLEKLFTEIAHLDGATQKQKLEQALDKHQGEAWQVDDITVLGVRL